MPSRQAAMDSLMQVKERALEGKPNIAFVWGGPFLGKSRLINEVAENAASDGFRVLKSFRTSLDSFTSFFPLRQIVSGAMIMCTSRADTVGGDNGGDEVAAANLLVERTVFNKTDRVNIGSVVPTVADAQLLSLLSGLNPKTKTKNIVDSLMKILKLLQPLMIVLEGDGDIDPSSWSLLAELMQRAAQECPQIMLIVSSRDSPTITSAASNLRRNAVQVKLTPFEKYETEEYLKVLLGVKYSDVTIDQRLLDVVHDRANGCPLFIECVVRWAAEKNMIEFVEGSKRMSLKTLDERSDDVTAAIPRELSNILLAPFNKLSPPLWDALKIASCIGYSFDADLYSTLNQVLDFMPKIRELAVKYDCFDQTGVHFRWKQQAVYEAVKSLLMLNQRQKIHRMIVRAFEQNHGEIDDIKGGDIRRLLGRHCALAEDWAGAFEQYMRAGDRAKALFNFNEASKMYEEAIDFQAKMSEQLPLRTRMVPTINLGTCLRELARYKEAETVLTRCLNEAQRELSDVALDEELYVRALTALAALYQARSKYDSARKLFERAVPIARNIQESKSSLWLAENIAGYAETLRKSGDLPQAEKHHREALAIRTRAVEEKSCTELELAVSYTQLGCTLAGMRQYKEAYQQHQNALTLRYRYLDFSHGLVSESLNYCGESLCALGRSGEGISLALHAVEIRKPIFGTSHPAYAHALSVLASCYHAVGRYFDACDCLETCLEICEVAFQKNHANIIPNLMNYGNVLRSTGDLV
jgi:tetratricopeptide (TPR) repeat protein